jgi:hypothetical protein
MSIGTYAELRTAVAAWLKRTDLTAQILDFIRLAEVRIKSLVDLGALETTATLATTPDSSTIALPADFKNPIALWIDDIDPQEQLTQLLPQSLPYYDTPNRPQYWAIDGANIRFQCPADAAYPIKFRYSQLFELSDANPTNSILTGFPDVYLFGALAEAADYSFDNENGLKWNAKFQDAVQRCNGLQSAENKNVPLMTEISRIARQRFNIMRGY